MAVRLSELLRDVPEPLRSEWSSRPLEEWGRLCGSVSLKSRRLPGGNPAADLVTGDDRRPVSAPSMVGGSGGGTTQRVQTPGGHSVSSYTPTGGARGQTGASPPTPQGGSTAQARRTAAEAQRVSSTCPPACTAAFDLLDKWVRAMRPLAPCGTLPAILAELVHGNDAELPEDPLVADFLKRLVPDPDALVAAGGRWRYLEDILEVAVLEDTLRPDTCTLVSRKPFLKGGKGRRSSPTPQQSRPHSIPASSGRTSPGSNPGVTVKGQQQPPFITSLGELRKVGVTKPVRRATEGAAPKGLDNGRPVGRVGPPVMDPWVAKTTSTRLVARPSGPGPGEYCPRLPQQGSRGPRLAPRGNLLRRTKSAASLSRAQRTRSRQQLMIECTSSGMRIEEPSASSPDATAGAVAIPTPAPLEHNGLGAPLWFDEDDEEAP